MKILLLLCIISVAFPSLTCYAFVPPSSLRESRWLQQSPLRMQRSSSAQTIGPTVEFTDPSTGCEVVLLGCFHGTESSAEDVRKVVTPETDIVVLELCSSRFKSVQREAQDTETVEATGVGGYIDRVVQTVKSRGVATGIAAAIIGGFTEIQSLISGFVPGLEFKTALEQSIINDCDIVLADQVVDETLRRIGSLPQISWRMNMSKNTTRVLEDWAVYSGLLKEAVIGDESLPRVELGKFLVRNSAAVKDLLRFVVPPFSTMFVLVQAAYALADDNIIISDPTVLEQLLHYLASAALLLSTYVGFFLPAIQVVLFERDLVLTNGIKASCERAGKGGRVVAVLGFLHVNGVAKQMLEETV